MLLQQQPMNSSSSSGQYTKCEFCAGNYGAHLSSCRYANNATTSQEYITSLQMSEEEETWLMQTLVSDDTIEPVLSASNIIDNTNLNVINHQIDDITNDSTQCGDFLNELGKYLENNTTNIPFDYIDLWVPVLDESSNNKMKLNYAGHKVLSNSSNRHNKNGFGKYSMLFSFEAGQGIPGRVYTLGSPVWESDLTSCTYFERSYGAKKYGINTCCGLPINSTIGRIVIIFYTESQLCHRDDYVISRLQKIIISNWNPCPRWKLSLECGLNDATIIPIKTSSSTSSSPNFKPISDVPTQPIIQTPVSPLIKQSSSSTSSPLLEAIKENSAATTSANNKYIDFQIANLLAEEMPVDDNSPFTSGFVALRLLLLRSIHNTQEEDMLTMLRKSYHGYKVVQRASKDIALLLVQDYMFLKSVFAKQGTTNNTNSSNASNNTSSDITVRSTAVTVRSVSYGSSIAGNNNMDTSSSSSANRKDSPTTSNYSTSL